MSRFFLPLILLCISSLTALAASPAADIEKPSGWNHFVWGAEVGGSIDLTSNVLSSLNLDAYFGYKNSWINALGVGASVNMMVNNSVRAFPIYALLRTDFSSLDRLLFLDLRGGIALNNLPEGHYQTSLYMSPGVGINLARGKSFCSYITLSYVYNGLKPFDLSDRHCDVDGLSMACLRLGISF